jgi:hypothetical protein
MIEQRSQNTELLATRPAWATIHLLLVCRGIDMLVQARQLAKTLVTEIAFVDTPGVVVGRCACGSSGCVGEAGEELLRDEAFGVAAAYFGEDGLAVHGACFGAGSGLEMVRYTRRSGEAVLAEGTGDVGAAVNFAVEMLLNVSTGVALLTFGRLTAFRLFSFSKPF